MTRRAFAFVFAVIASACGARQPITDLVRYDDGSVYGGCAYGGES